MLFLIIPAVFSQNSIDSVLTSKDTTGFKPNKESSASVPRINNSGIDADGNLNEAAWSKAKKFDNFSEVDPGDNTKPSVSTTAYVFYDDDYIYVGFISYEPDVKSIRKTFTSRDLIFNDDWVGFFFDTYNEKKQAYELIVNPYGIQADLMWTAPGNEDENFDAIWYSGAKIHSDSWTAEFVIPFKSIRFPNKSEQVWNFHLFRNHPRKNREQISWTPISRDDPTLYTHPGKMYGIKDIKGGNNLEILPYTLGSQQGSISDYGNSQSEFNNEKIKGQVGINVKYGITSNLTADLAINPDFSQVESDAAQVDVNNAFALFYTEKRPFFIEGNNIFNSPMNVIYTRSINNPLFAFKLSGKIGRTDVGYMVAYDQKSPFIIPFQEHSDFISTDRTSTSNILRVKHTVGDKDSYIGMILTDREVNKDDKNGKKAFDVDGYNRVFGFDGTFRLLDNYSFTFQSLRLFTREINYPDYGNSEKFDNGKYTAALDGEYYAGFSNVLSFNRSARHWNFNVSYNDASPVSRRDNGFNSNNDFRTIQMNQVYDFYPEGKVIKRVEPSVFGYMRYDYDGKIREQFAQATLYFRFPYQMSTNVSVFLANNESFKGVFHQGARRVNANFSFQTFDWLRGNIYAATGKSIVRSDDSYIGYVNDLELSIVIKPLDRVTLENTYNYYELLKEFAGEKIYAGYIFRNKTNVQVTKNLSARLIFQFDTFSNNFTFSPLISYKLNPFTIFYVGSTYNYNQIDTPNDVAKQVLTDRQYFMKLQYLWRL
jgi:Domain of unknown function (DUF5916)/Carbohydrate family 9 binding domain-like